MLCVMEEQKYKNTFIHMHIYICNIYRISMFYQVFLYIIILKIFVIEIEEVVVNHN